MAEIKSCEYNNDNDTITVPKKVPYIRDWYSLFIHCHGDTVPFQIQKFGFDQADHSKMWNE